MSNANGHPQLDNLFADPAWKPFSFSLAKEIGAYPNRIYFNSDENIGAVVAFRGKHDSWALNEAAVNYLHNAVHNGRISEGYAILATNTPQKVVSVAGIEDVVKILDGVPCRDGDFGNYRWVDEKFRCSQSVELAKAPF